MPKHIDNIPSLEDFRAPWESEAGETEIDKPRLKRYIYNLTTDKAKAQDARDEALEKVTTLESEVTSLKDEIENATDADSVKKIAKLEKEKADLEAQVESFEVDKLKREVAEEKGLDSKKAKYLSGKTREELEASADEILEDFGLKAPEGDDEGEDSDDEDEFDGALSPQFGRRLVTPTARKDRGDEPDFDSIVSTQILAPRVI